MALVKCPECGKENVSDSADTCPNCGFGIKNYFEKKKQTELNRRRYEEKLKNIPKPEVPSFSWGTFWTVGWFGFLGCPQCNSTNIEKISTVNRATSIAMTGLASNKIGKQYKCKDCKHMW